MAELAGLRARRTNIVSRLTRCKTYFDSVNKDLVDDLAVGQVQVRLEKIAPVWDEFNEIQSQIENVTSQNNEIVPDERVRDDFESKYFKLIGDMQALCNKFNRSLEGNSVAGSERALSQNGSAVTSANRVSLVKLPPIKLPTFNGQYSDWLEFKDAFVALVDSDESLTDIQKFYYLRSSLDQKVLETIKYMDVSERNYKEAWKFLNERFENKKIIVYNHVRAIFEHPVVVRESYKDLRNLFDNITKHLRCLKSLGEQTEAWDRLIIYIMSNKFDSITRRDWETFKYEGDLPTMQDLNKFLMLKCEVLEKLEVSDRQEVRKVFRGTRGPGQGSSYAAVDAEDSLAQENKFKCFYCHQDHSIFKCESFLKLPTENRITAVKRLKLCFICLRDSHPYWKCKRPKCFRCKKAHNTLLHAEFDQKHNTLPNTPTDGAKVEITNGLAEGASHSSHVGVVRVPAECAVADSVSISNNVVNNDSQVLLSTAVVQVCTKDKVFHARALLDSGSQSNFITRDFCKKANLAESKLSFKIKGIGQNLTNINSQTSVKIKSRFSDFSLNINCLVLPKITDRLPVMSFDKGLLPIPENVRLADPQFNISSDIDILLGSNAFWAAVKGEQIRLGSNLPILQKTEFGFVIAGNLNLNSTCHMSVTCHTLSQQEYSDKLLVKFWEIEDVVGKKKMMSKDEEYCEIYFKETTQRDKNGRFVVRIPFKSNLKLGNCRDVALNRLNLLEKRLNKDLNLKKEYAAFLNEYAELGHMSVVTDDDMDGYFLPHHAVIKGDSLTTKCRVVFDASAKSDTGVSLNDIQYVGPTLQHELFSILLRFRLHQYVLTGDISKMYRQINVHEDDRKFQRIFWRNDVGKVLQIFKLNTVTYGCASSPYLAVKCLHVLAEENSEKFPVASRVIKTDFYMDDVLTGANSKEELLKIQSDIVSILASAGFELRKFLCNDFSILNKFEVNKNLDAHILSIGETENNKTLGIFWNPLRDSIQYKVQDFKDNELKDIDITKRSVLSLISKIFDPLGLISPIVVQGKILMQEIWKNKVSWDDNIPLSLAELYLSFKMNLVGVGKMEIPRHALMSEYVRIEMHGFSDASMKAYGACLYVRCITSTGRIGAKLLCAKSRVAPLKQISLPRLELCGALLLANLGAKTLNSLNVEFNKIYWWTDSTITLNWIAGEPYRWKIFVANRVSEIRSLTNCKDWHHVRTDSNPADLISRGVSSETLDNSSLWWHGPEWFQSDESTWQLENVSVQEQEIPEQRVVVCLSIQPCDELNYGLEKFSSLQKSLRVLGYVLRFIKNLKMSCKECNKQTGPLTPDELNEALEQYIKNVQIQCFASEYNALLNNKEISKSSRILGLNPFLHKGLIRVGGRIEKSSQPFEQKHPIILPQGHKLTESIIREEHMRLLHCGVQCLIYSVRQRFWPLSGRKICKGVVRKCIKCFRAKPGKLNYLMGDLPEVRVNAHSVFLNVGTDFGGPFLLKDRFTRNPKLVKCYICLFVCMSTKAVHIELVSELTTAAFLAAFRRFVSRRGRPTNIYSDNGSNYIGANNELGKLYDFLGNNCEYIANQLASERIKWNFIPARSPTFGGIWEAGIKSVKFHLKRVVGDKSLNFEEFGTILAQIEGILNSRPICPINDDPDDLTALTPGHFLIGRTLSSLPERSFMQVPENRLRKWEKLQSMVQHYWARWQREYLTELQVRTKWKLNCNHMLKIGTLVLIRNDNASSLHWELGRIVQLYPGKDGVVRVVKLKVRDGTTTRAVNRICALPVED